MERSSVKAAKGRKPVKFLPKATSFSFTNPGFSPGREKTLTRRGFSGPLLPVPPAERGRNPAGGGFETLEPSSPKVSCIGQIKHKKKICRSKSVAAKRSSPRKSLSLGWIFRIKTRSRKPAEEPAKAAAPPLGQMRRFASGRDTLTNFDWRAQRVASDESPGLRGEDEKLNLPHSASLAAGDGAAAQERCKGSTLWKKRNMVPLTPLKL